MLLCALLHGRTYHWVAGAQAAGPFEEWQWISGKLHDRWGGVGGDPPGPKQHRVFQLLWGKCTEVTAADPEVAPTMLRRNSCPSYIRLLSAHWYFDHILVSGTGRHQRRRWGGGQFHGWGGGPGCCGGRAQCYLTPSVTAEAGHGPHTGGLSSTCYCDTTSLSTSGSNNFLSLLKWLELFQPSRSDFVAVGFVCKYAAKWQETSIQFSLVSLMWQSLT